MGNEKNFENDNEIQLNLQGTSPKKSAKKWPIIVAVLLLVVAIGAAVLYFVFDSESAGDETITIIDVERQNAPELSYDPTLIPAVSGTKVSVDLNINKMALSLLGENFEGLEMIDFLNDISVEAAIEHNENMSKVGGGFTYSDKELADLELLFDSETGKIYLVSEKLTDSYIVFDIHDIEGMEALAQMSAWSEAVSQYGSLFNQYYERFLNLLVTQEVKSENVTVNNVTQECKVYVAKINANELVSLLNDFINDAKKLDSNSGEIFDSLQQQLNEAECEDDINWIIYVNDSGEIIGRDISIGDEQMLQYKMTAQGEEIGLVFSLAELEINGSGEIKENKLTGTFDLLIDDTKYLEISPEDYNLEDHKKGVPNGEIKIKFTKKLLKELLNIDLDLPLSITIDLQSTENTKEICVDFMEVVDLNVRIDYYEPDVIALPEGDEIDGSDTDALNRWLESIDIEGLKDELEKLGLISFFETEG